MTLKEIHAATLEILSFIDETCKKLNLQYYALYGTALGAVRHHGFIPWDDDLDIGMQRDDYNLFCEYINEHNTGSFYIDNYYTNHDYPYYIMRLCDRRYSLLFDGYKYKSGLFIDIYPLDGMGKENDSSYWAKRKSYLTLVQTCYLLASNESVFVGSSTIKRILRMPLCIISKILGKKVFFKLLDRYANVYSYQESDFIGVPCWSMRLTRYKKDIFNSTIRVPFENISITLPAGYDEMLKSDYGDYMTLPPPDKRKATHYYVAYKND